jgi:hypothetical protein
MPFRVEPASYADLDILADVLVKAHVNDKLFQQLFPRVPHGMRVTWYADAFRKTWEKKWIRYYKVVDVETRSVSFLCYDLGLSPFLMGPFPHSFQKNPYFSTLSTTKQLIHLHSFDYLTNRFAALSKRWPVSNLGIDRVAKFEK